MVFKRRHLVFALCLMLCLSAVLIGIRNTREKPVVEMYTLTMATGADMPLFYVKTDRKVAALTFDISWGNKIPEEVLKVLKEYDQKATFFLSGPWANHYKDTVRRIVAEGHEIASHGHDHVNLSQEDKDSVTDNIQTAHNILVNLTNTSPKYFRPPNGDYDDLVVLTARELGYETVIWAVDSLDWKDPGPSYIVERVSKLIFPGAIILFHASDSARRTHEALPMVFENLKTAGYDLLTLGELMTLGKPARDDPRGRPMSELPGH
ncbi:MAG: polysaccharide deacetylase family protein [Bacillota bacterium]|jgi:polysaccharide deacetylase family sporulation protein PdaB